MNRILEYTVRIGLDGHWVTGSCVIPDYLPDEVIDEDIIAMVILSDAYENGEIEVSYKKGEIEC